jgi:hypothetical protein
MWISHDWIHTDDASLGLNSDRSTLKSHARRGSKVVRAASTLKTSEVGEFITKKKSVLSSRGGSHLERSGAFGLAVLIFLRVFFPAGSLKSGLKVKLYFLRALHSRSLEGLQQSLSSRRYDVCTDVSAMYCTSAQGCPALDVRRPTASASVDAKLALSTRSSRTASRTPLRVDGRPRIHSNT